MHVILWVVQILLAGVFLFSAYAKGTWSQARLVASGQTGVQGLPLGLIRFIAFCELLGALGLILPIATGIVPASTPVAALGLGTIMVLAAIVHARLGEPRNVLANCVLLSLCLVDAYGRSSALLEDHAWSP